MAELHIKSCDGKSVTALMHIWPDYSWQVAPQQSLLPLDPVT